MRTQNEIYKGQRVTQSKLKNNEMLVYSFVSKLVKYIQIYTKEFCKNDRQCWIQTFFPERDFCSSPRGYCEVLRVFLHFQHKYTENLKTSWEDTLMFRGKMSSQDQPLKSALMISLLVKHALKLKVSKLGTSRSLTGKKLH